MTNFIKELYYGYLNPQERPVIKDNNPTVFGTITRKTTDISFLVRVERGVYINDRSLAENNYVLDETTDLLMNCQSSEEIEIDGKKIFYDVLIKFFDEDGKQILTKRMDTQYLREIIRSAIPEIDVDECLVGRKNTEIVLLSVIVGDLYCRDLLFDIGMI